MILYPARRPLIQLLGAIGIAATLPLIVWGVFGGPVRDPNRLRYMVAALQLKTFDEVLQRYRADNNKTPGLTGPHLDKLPLDPWGRPYVYESFDPPRIVSYGADGVPGGRFFDADLTSADPIRSIPESPYEVRVNRIRIVLGISALLLFVGSLYQLVRASRAAH
jgi:hypothetical protein